MSAMTHQKCCKDGDSQAIWSSYLLITKFALGAKHETTGFTVYPTGFWYCFSPTGFYLPIFPFWNGNVYPVSQYTESV